MESIVVGLPEEHIKTPIDAKSDYTQHSGAMYKTLENSKINL